VKRIDRGYIDPQYERSIPPEDVMTKLTTDARKKLPKSDFALPGGRYPVEDKAHARDAKARAAQGYKSGHLSATEKAKVDKKAGAVLAKKGK
jgi:hypothetical protein